VHSEGLPLSFGGVDMDSDELIAALHQRSSREDTMRLATAGMGMSDAEVSRLEEILDQRPDSIDTRLRLLGYYTKRHVHDPSAKTNRSRHVLWFLENEPEATIVLSPFARLELDETAYEEGKRILMAHLKHRRATRELLQNASYFMSTLDKDMSAVLWEQAKDLPSAQS
jgi:hypothetical protein